MSRSHTARPSPAASGGAGRPRCRRSGISGRQAGSVEACGAITTIRRRRRCAPRTALAATAMSSRGSMRRPGRSRGDLHVRGIDELGGIAELARAAAAGSPGRRRAAEVVAIRAAAAASPPSGATSPARSRRYRAGDTGEQRPDTGEPRQRRRLGVSAAAAAGLVRAAAPAPDTSARSRMSAASVTPLSRDRRPGFSTMSEPEDAGLTVRRRSRQPPLSARTAPDQEGSPEDNRLDLDIARSSHARSSQEPFVAPRSAQMAQFR